MTKKMLPVSWVNHIFARLDGVYGAEFTGKFSKNDENGFDLGLANAKQVWAEELSGFSENKGALAYALRNLPARAPNLIVFRDLCRAAPRDNPVALEHKEDWEKCKEAGEKNLKAIWEILGTKVMKETK